MLGWARDYDRSWLSADVLAGLTVWGLVIPESMAYAGVAGLPAQFGLYTLLASLFAYALIGTSRQLMVQPTSASAALMASAIPVVVVAAGLAEDGASIDPADYQEHAIAFTLVVGALFLVAAVARLGFITQFLSKPVLDGFITGLAVYVMVGQLYHLFGVEKPSGNTVQKFVAILRDLPEANWVSVVVGVAALVLLVLLPCWSQRLPVGLFVLFGSIAVSSILDLATLHDVEVVGELPQGLPTPGLPSVSLRRRRRAWSARRSGWSCWRSASRWASLASTATNTTTRSTRTASSAPSASSTPSAASSADRSPAAAWPPPPSTTAPVDGPSSPGSWPGWPPSRPSCSSRPCSRTCPKRSSRR